MNNLCPICKTSYPPDVKFCINDGAKLVTTDSSVQHVEPQIHNPFEQTAPVVNNPFQNSSDENNPFQKNPFEKNVSEYKSTANTPYIKASLSSRFIAALLDGLIVLGLAIPGSITLVFAFIAAYGSEEEATIVLGILGILLTLIPIAYQLLKDGRANGQSYGKKSQGIMVIDLETNAPCNKTKSFLRNIIYVLFALIPFVGYFIEPIMILVTDNGRRLGDRAANTMVIEKNT